MSIAKISRFDCESVGSLHSCPPNFPHQFVGSPRLSFMSRQLQQVVHLHNGSLGPQKYGIFMGGPSRCTINIWMVFVVANLTCSQYDHRMGKKTDFFRGGKTPKPTDEFHIIFPTKIVDETVTRCQTSPNNLGEGSATTRTSFWIQTYDHVKV